MGSWGTGLASCCMVYLLYECEGNLMHIYICMYAYLLACLRSCAFLFLFCCFCPWRWQSVILVVDSSDHARITLCKAELHKLLQNEASCHFAASKQLESGHGFLWKLRVSDSLLCALSSCSRRPCCLFLQTNRMWKAL